MRKPIENSGFSLMEVIVSLFIILIIMIGVYNLIVLALQTTAANKNYVEATGIAKQRIEQVHSLSYGKVGTLAGNPTGLIPDCELVTRGNLYTVCTNVEYQDDPFDGLLTDALPDTSPADYKKVSVTVSWEEKGKNKEITVYTKVVAASMETNSDEGLLRILVTDSGYLNPSQIIAPVAGAKVRIYNPSLAVDEIMVTDSDGLVNYLASSSDDYQITVSHFANPNDWGTDQTFGTTTGQTPQHLAVYEGLMTYEQFTIDKKGIINVKTALASNLPQTWRVNKNESERTKKNLRFSQDAGGNLYFTWEAEAATSTHVYMQKYDSAIPPTAQWANDIRLDDTFYQLNPDIVTSPSGYSYVAWEDNSILRRKTVYAPKRRYAKNRVNLLTYSVSPWPADQSGANLAMLSPLPDFSFKILPQSANSIAIKFSEIKDDLADLLLNYDIPFAQAAYGDYGLKVQKYTGDSGGNVRTKDVFLTTPVDPSHAFVIMNSWWATAYNCTLGIIGGCCQPDEHQATAYLDPSGMKVTVERYGISNSDNSTDQKFYYSFYVIEAQNEEFVVRARDSLTIDFDQSSTTEVLYENFNDADKLTVFANSRMENVFSDTQVDHNFLGYATLHTYHDGSDWRIKAWRGGVSPGGARKFNTIVRYELVEWLSPLVEVQTGEISANIGTGGGNYNLATPVEANRTWLYTTMRHNSNGLAQTSVRVNLTNNNTIYYERAQGTYNSAIRWYTIQFPRGVVVQRGSDSAAAGDTAESAALSPAVDTAYSWSDSTQASESTSDNFPRERWTETIRAGGAFIDWWRRSDGHVVDFYYEAIDTHDWDQPVMVAATGTQVATLDSPSADSLVGAFVLSKYNFYSKIARITITEHGTVDAADKIDNIRLLYDVDNTLPYNCGDRAFAIGDSQFGATDTDGFSGANGTSTFISASGLWVKATNTICLYVVADVAADVVKYDTLDIKIDNPLADVILTPGTGYLIQEADVAIPGATELLLPPIPDLTGYIWREDDGDEVSASNYPANTFIAKKPGETARLRFSLNNAGSKNLSGTYQLKFGKKSAYSCGSVGSWIALGPAQDWDLFDSSNVSNAAPSTGLADLDNPNTNFVSGGIYDTSDTTGNISLNHDNFTEIEFSVVSDPAIDEAGYCFRLEKTVDNSATVYTTLPEITIVGDHNIFLRKIDNTDGSAVWTKQVNTDENFDYDRQRPRVALIRSGGNDFPVVAWQDSRGNAYAQKFDQDGNMSWNGSEDQPIASTSALEAAPYLAVDTSGDLIAAWVSDGKILMQKFASTTGLAVWSASTTVEAGANDAPAVGVDASNNIYISYEQNGQDVYVEKFDAVSTALWKFSANQGSSASSQYEPSLMLDNANSFVYVSWTDDRRGNEDVYVQKFDYAAGAYAWPEDYRINFDTGGADQSASALLLRGTDPIVSWQDSALAQAARFRPEGPSSLVPKPNVQLAATSTKTVSLNPVTPKISTTFQTDGLGEHGLFLEHDFDGYFFLTTAGDTIYATDPALPLVLEPDQPKILTIYIN